MHGHKQKGPAQGYPVKLSELSTCGNSTTGVVW